MKSGHVWIFQIFNWVHGKGLMFKDLAFHRFYSGLFLFGPFLLLEVLFSCRIRPVPIMPELGKLEHIPWKQSWYPVGF